MISQLLFKHRDQFIAMGLPEHLHKVACEKILSQNFDAGSYFQFQEIDTTSEENESEDGSEDDNASELETEGLSTALATKYGLFANKSLKKGETVLLVDHMW